MTTILRRCAWCPPDETPVPEGAIVSHGICDNCTRTLLGPDEEPTPEPVPYESRPGTFYGHYGV